MMNIAALVENKFHNNQSIIKNITADSSLGILASGYVKKNTKQGSHIDYTTLHYDCILVLSGSGIYKDKNNTLEIKPGHFIQRFPNHTHSTIVTDDNWSELYIVLGESLFKSLSELQIISKEKPVITTGMDYELVQQFIDFFFKLKNANHIELPLLLSDVIKIITRASYLDKVNYPTTDEMNVLTLSTKFIKENIKKRITVDEIASYVNMGYEKFRKLFTAHYGVSPGTYIIHLRIQSAQKLLSEKDLTIKEIAFKLGYSDSYSFSKQFKKVTGVSPMTFRELYYNFKN